MKCGPVILLWAALVLAGSGTGTAYAAGQRIQLPSTVVPVRYELDIRPDADGPAFTGSVRIDIEVRTPVTEIVLNARDLDIGDAVLDDRTGDAPRVTLDPERQTATFSFPTPVPAGRHRLAVRKSLFRAVVQTQDPDRTPSRNRPLADGVGRPVTRNARIGLFHGT